MVRLMGILSKTFWLADRYTIVSDGVVFDHKLKREVKHHTTSDGYSKVTLRIGPESRKTYSVHRLVALSFIDKKRTRTSLGWK